MLDADRRLENKEETIDHVVGFYRNRFSKEEWDRPTIDNLELAFEEEEVKEAILNFVCVAGGGGGGGGGVQMDSLKEFQEGKII